MWTILPKRSDTKVKTLRKIYGDEFAKGYSSEAQLGTVLQREGVEALGRLLKKIEAYRRKEKHIS
jgi:hypothetical protein